MQPPKLYFSTSNAKLDSRLIFSLPAGYTCPSAGHCKTFADPVTGKITDLPNDANTIGPSYRCYAAMSEAISPSCRKNRWHNFNTIKNLLYKIDLNDKQDPQKTIDVISDTLSFNINHYNYFNEYSLCRIHESGDFWSELYFKAWLKTAADNPHLKFYAYTKQLTFWINSQNDIPNNMYLTASAGGNLDSLLARYAHIFKRISYVVYRNQDAIEKGLPIDHDDSHCFGDKPFALLLHGSQRAKTEASKALAERKQIGYSKNFKH